LQLQGLLALEMGAREYGCAILIEDAVMALGIAAGAGPIRRGGHQSRQLPIIPKDPPHSAAGYDHIESVIQVA